jgi:hypothetical protein
VAKHWWVGLLVALLWVARSKYPDYAVWIDALLAGLAAGGGAKAAEGVASPASPPGRPHESL